MKKEVISEFKRKPKTKTAWWAMGLGLGTVLLGPILGVFAAFIRPAIDRVSSESIGSAAGFGLIIFVVLLFASALATSIIALRNGERSWVLWIGVVPVILVAQTGIFMIIAEFIFPH